ncbi:type II secretion system F family protein [Bacillus cereus group sp. TH152-1LC]|uniref:type II secretion system F family protein n=1 Tax=Bacillus cereus group sp. TH152-1LC TaxID=3018060 RepID=UPI0022E0F602|nr:type II secretion system F family protein [Bacillus cereus group sp. TH152-1LC]MDA1674616.1 type II secretion system F family protein [Bacillus cereus group sp. TH152-1LC]
MPIFHFKALDQNGQIIEEKIETESMDQAIAEVNRRGVSLIEIKPVNSIMNSLALKKVSKKELASFTKQLSYLIETGISLHKGVEIIAEQIRNPYFKSIINQIVKDIKEGIPLSEASAKFPKVFPNAMIFQLKAAEAGGFMQEALVNISADLEREARFAKQVKGAMMYPSVVLVAAIGIVYFMLTMVVPKMAKTLTSFDAELPTITKVVMSASDIAKTYWYVFIIVVVLGIYLFKLLMKNPVYKKKYHAFLLKIPVIGNLVIAINIATMTRLMSSLLSSGVPIDDTLDNLKNVLSNKVLSDNIEKVRKEVVEEGYTLSKSMDEKPVFPKALVQILKVGEETGNLEDVLSSLADKYEEDVSDALKTMTALINPLLMIVIGAIVGVIVVSLFVPMFSLIDKL